jgi:hypothetical protein
MSQYPGGQPPQGGGYYGPPQGGDPYAPPQYPQDPYYGPPPGGDPYAPPQYPQDPYYAQQGYPPQGYPQGYPPPGYPQGYPPQSYWQPAPQPAPATSEGGRGSGAAIVGIFLVLVGLWFLFREEIGLDFGRVWPVVAVVLGVIMVIAAFIPRRRA